MDRRADIIKRLAEIDTELSELGNPCAIQFTSHAEDVDDHYQDALERKWAKEELYGEREDLSKELLALDEQIHNIRKGQLRSLVNRVNQLPITDEN